MVAVSCVALTNVVACGAPFKSTVLVLTKLLPVTVNVNAGEPALTGFGEIDVITGTGFVVLEIVKFTEFDDPPPGVGLLTNTAALAAVSTSSDWTVVVNCVALTNVVAWTWPLKCMTELETKFVPFTVNVNALEPAAMLVGEIVVIAGTGFAAAVTLKFIEFDAPPPGFGLLTNTAGVLAVATSAVRIAAVS